MSILTTDIVYRLATTAGAAGNTTASTPATSLGKYVSTTVITAASLNNLFDDMSAAENAALTADHRLFFVLNNHATLSLTSPVVWISSQTGGGPTWAISVDTTGVTAKGAAPAQAKTIATETTAPATQTFASPSTKGTGLAIADIPAGSVQGIWVRCTGVAGAALSPDIAVLRVEGNTA